MSEKDSNDAGNDRSKKEPTVIHVTFIKHSPKNLLDMSTTISNSNSFIHLSTLTNEQLLGALNSEVYSSAIGAWSSVRGIYLKALQLVLESRGLLPQESNLNLEQYYIAHETGGFSPLQEPDPRTLFSEWADWRESGKIRSFLQKHERELGFGYSDLKAAIHRVALAVLLYEHQGVYGKNPDPGSKPAVFIQAN